jgi:hypothetical protein
MGGNASTSRRRHPPRRLADEMDEAKRKVIPEKSKWYRLFKEKEGEFYDLLDDHYDLAELNSNFILKREALEIENLNQQIKITKLAEENIHLKEKNEQTKWIAAFACTMVWIFAVRGFISFVF